MRKYKDTEPVWRKRYSQESTWTYYLAEAAYVLAEILQESEAILQASRKDLDVSRYLSSY